MRKIFRVIYPFLIYVSITNAIVLAAAYLMTAYRMINHGGLSYNAAYGAVIEMLNSQLIYWTAGSAAITSLVLALFYQKDCMMREQAWPDDSRVKGMGSIVLLGAASCVAGNNFIALLRLDLFFPSYGEVEKNLYIGSLMVQLLCVGVLVPIAEEMVFRVLGFRRLRDYMSFIPAALITAVLFGLYHGNVVQGVYAFILGLVIAYAYELYDRPVVPIVIHMSANMFSLILTTLPIFSGAYGPTIIVTGTVAAILIGMASLKKIQFYGLTNK